MFTRPLNAEYKSVGIRQWSAIEQFAVFVYRQAHYRSRTGDVLRWIRKTFRIQIIDQCGVPSLIDMPREDCGYRTLLSNVCVNM
jgi:hypothetical protein